MLRDIDQALNYLRSHLEKLEALLQNHFSEADTRVKFIDPVLTNVLGWSETPHIRREERYSENDEQRCIDYTISLNEPVLVVEAKKLLKDFEIPTTTGQTRFKLDGVIQKWTNAWSAVQQARAYCDKKGARYALVTNGHQYIAFKAISERPGGWTKGYALVWRSPEDLLQRFTQFYECLSRETIAQDTLSTLANEPQDQIIRQRPRAQIGAATGGGYRNDLYDVLQQAFSSLLLDTPDEPSTEFLEQCYCTNESIIRYGRQLDSILVDEVPSFRAPIHPVKAGHKKDPFDSKITSMVTGRASKPLTNPLVVVMGGAGVGKTTFLQWYFKTKVDPKTREKCVVLTCDYRNIEAEPPEIRTRTLRTLVEQLSSQTKSQTGTYEQMKEIFREEIQSAVSGELKPWASDSVELEKRISDLLRQLRSDDLTNLKRICNYLRARAAKTVVIVLDNIDQKDEKLQVKLYQVAQELVHATGAIVLIVLRESTYSRLTHSPELDAFSAIDFHVRMQPAAVVIDKRLEYLGKLLGEDDDPIDSVSGTSLRVKDLRRFLALMGRSLLSEQADPEIARCIEAVSRPATRGQLRTVYDFLISGQTKISSYLFQTPDYIPFHEFLSSIILEDRKVFTEREGGRFMNVFALGPGSTASHFTVLRILTYFQSVGQEGDATPNDFLSPTSVFEQFESQGISKEAIASEMERMAAFGLLLAESQKTTDLKSDERFAVSRCGLYYLDTIYHNFTYFSNMVADTMMTDPPRVAYCASVLRKASTFPHIPIAARLDVADQFVTYLELAEEREMMHGVAASHPVFGASRFVPAIRENLEQVRERVQRNQPTR